MAYLRWGRDSDWYAFWESTLVPVSEKKDERLALWHAGVRTHQYYVTYADARQMLETRAFFAIPGFREEYRREIAEILASFVADVDSEYGSRP